MTSAREKITSYMTEFKLPFQDARKLIMHGIAGKIRALLRSLYEQEITADFAYCKLEDLFKEKFEVEAEAE